MEQIIGRKDTVTPFVLSGNIGHTLISSEELLTGIIIPPVLLNDAFLGRIFAASATPVSFSPASGQTYIMLIDQTYLPGGALPQSGTIKYSFTAGSEDSILMFTLMVYHGLTWTTIKTWKQTTHANELGRVAYTVPSSITASALLLYGQVFDGTTGLNYAVKVLAGLEFPGIR